MALILLPNLLLGSSIGVIINTLLPNIALVISFIIFVIFVFTKTIKKAKIQIPKELAARKQRALDK